MKRNNIELVEIELPTHWAPYLINGDDSGYDRHELADIAEGLDAIRKEHGCVHCVSVSENSRIVNYGGLLTDVSTYVFHRIAQKPTRIPMSAIKAACEGKTNWFDKGAMRFFGTKLPRYGYEHDGKAYFVSSEQCPFPGTYPRLYTVRVADLATGQVDTIGEFQAHKTRADARAAIKAIINGSKP